MVDWLGTGRLTRIQDGVFESAEGLRYAVDGANEGHRIAHVLKHAVDDPSRNGLHGVFTGNPLDIIDNAWSQRVGDGVFQPPTGNYMYEIPMPNAGYVGGAQGAAANFPQADTVVIITRPDRTTVVTAYPKE